MDIALSILHVSRRADLQSHRTLGCLAERDLGKPCQLRAGAHLEGAGRLCQVGGGSGQTQRWQSQVWGVALGSLTDLERAAAVRSAAHKTPPAPKFIPGLRKRRRNCSGG